MSNSKDNNIDLIDFLIVIIRHKWVVLGIIITAVIAAIAYANLFKHQDIIRYSAEVIIRLPEQYRIASRYYLSPSKIDPNVFLTKLNDALARAKAEIKSNKEDFQYTMIMEEPKRVSTPSLSITLSGFKETVIDKVFLMQKSYSDFSQSVYQRNNDLLNTIQRTIEEQRIENSRIRKKLYLFMEHAQLQKLSESEKLSALDMLYRYNLENATLNIARDFNKNVLLYRGDFILYKNESNHISLINENPEVVASYLKPLQSRRKIIIPVIALLLVGIFAAVLAAFVIEFFTREDVRNRLRATKKNSSNQN